MDCIFCNLNNISEDILYEDENFFIKVGIGIVTAGHVMIISKQHIPCFGALPQELVEKYIELKEKVKIKISKEFSEPFMIEYGIWGQSVAHAHTHIIPSKTAKYKIDDIIKEMIIPNNINFTKTNQKDLINIFNKEGKYVSIESNNNFYVCDVKNFHIDKNKPYHPLRYRDFFVEKKGIKGISSWSLMTEEDKINDKIKRDSTKKKICNF